MWTPWGTVTGCSIPPPSPTGPDGVGPSASRLWLGTRAPPTRAAASPATSHGVAAARNRRRPRCVRDGARVLPVPPAIVLPTVPALSRNGTPQVGVHQQPKCAGWVRKSADLPSDHDPKALTCAGLRHLAAPVRGHHRGPRTTGEPP